MLAVVTGGAASGKSQYAEQLLCALSEGERYYLAAMQRRTPEDDLRISRHRAMRAGRDFTTIECPTGLGSLTLPKGSAALLECLSNLLANELFSPEGAGAGAEEKILHGIERLSAQTAHLVVVTNEIASDGVRYAPATANYLAALGRLNQALFFCADCAVEVVCGIPIVMKGGNPLCQA